MSGVDARPLIGEQLAGAADAALHLVDRPAAGRARRTISRSRFSDAAGNWRIPPSPCTGSSRMAAVSGPISRSAASTSSNGDLVEAVDLGAEALQILLLAAGRDGGKRTAVKGALEGDDAVALGPAVHIVEAARRLDRAFERLGTGIGEEHLVGEGRRGEPLAEPRLTGDLVEIGDVPQPGGLLGQRSDQMRMAVAERVDGDAAGEIQITLAVGGDQPAAFAALERQRRARKGVIQRRPAHPTTPTKPMRRLLGRAGDARRRPAETKKPSPRTAQFAVLSEFSDAVSTRRPPVPGRLRQTLHRRKISLFFPEVAAAARIAPRAGRHASRPQVVENRKKQIQPVARTLVTESPDIVGMRQEKTRFRAADLISRVDVVCPRQLPGRGGIPTVARCSRRIVS